MSPLKVFLFVCLVYVIESKRVAHTYNFDNFANLNDHPQVNCDKKCHDSLCAEVKDLISGDNDTTNQCDCENFPSLFKEGSNFWKNAIAAGRLKPGHFKGTSGTGPIVDPSVHPSHYLKCDTVCAANDDNCRYSRLDMEHCHTCATIDIPYNDQCDCGNSPSRLKVGGVWWKHAVDGKTIGFF